MAVDTPQTTNLRQLHSVIESFWLQGSSALRKAIEITGFIAGVLVIIGATFSTRSHAQDLQSFHSLRFNQTADRVAYAICVEKKACRLQIQHLTNGRIEDVVPEDPNRGFNGVDFIEGDRLVVAAASKAGEAAETQIAILNLTTGQTRDLTDSKTFKFSPKVSPSRKEVLFAEIGSDELKETAGRPGRLIRLTKVNLDSGLRTEVTAEIFYNLYSADFYDGDDRYLVSAFRALINGNTEFNWKNNAYVFGYGTPMPAVTFPNGFLTLVATDRKARNIAFVAMVNQIDGRRGNYSYDIFRYNTERQEISRITHLNTFIHSIAISPDGKSIAFIHNRKSQRYGGEIILVSSNGATRTLRR